MSQNQFAADFLDVLASILDEVLTDQIDERCVLKGLPDWLLQPLERQLNGNKLDLASGKSVVPTVRFLLPEFQRLCTK